MFLVKFLDESHRDDALKFGKIRIGTINYYRNIEDTSRQETGEGLGNIVWAGDELSAEDHNRIFSPFEKVQLKKGWKIKTSGVPLHGTYPNFNAYTFCYSEVSNTKEIDSTSGGKATSYYFITDPPEFIKKISIGLRPVAVEAIRKYEPENADRLIENLTVEDVTYRIHYSDTLKSRVVNQENLSTFIPKTFYPQDFFQKPTSFSNEKEVRTIWLFWSKDHSGKKYLLPLPHPDEKHQDLELGQLPISKIPKCIKYEIKTSTSKPKDT